MATLFGWLGKLTIYIYNWRVYLLHEIHLQSFVASFLDWFLLLSLIWKNFGNVEWMEGCGLRLVEISTIFETQFHVSPLR